MCGWEERNIELYCLRLIIVIEDKPVHSCRILIGEIFLNSEKENSSATISSDMTIHGQWIINDTFT